MKTVLKFIITITCVVPAFAMHNRVTPITTESNKAVYYPHPTLSTQANPNPMKFAASASTTKNAKAATDGDSCDRCMHGTLTVGGRSAGALGVVVCAVPLAVGYAVDRCICKPCDDTEND